MDTKITDSSEKNSDKQSSSIFLLFFLILSVAISPRIQVGALGGQAIDLRIQDFIIPLVLINLLLSKNYISLFSRLWSHWWPIFLWGSSTGIIFILLINPEFDVKLAVSFGGRTLETFALVYIIGALSTFAGSQAARTVFLSVWVGVVLNMLWVAYQLLSNTQETLLGKGIGASYSYGPMLIGESSPFGTGQYFAFVGAFGAAILISEAFTPLSGWALILLGSLGAFLAASRVSMGAILLAVLLVLLLSPNLKKVRTFTFTIVGLAVLSLAFLVTVDSSVGRLSLKSIFLSTTYRVQNNWLPIVDQVSYRPFLGLGPGGLGGREAHSMIVRAWADYGFLFGSLLLALILIVWWKAFKYMLSESVSRQDSLFASLAFIFLSMLVLSGTFQDAFTAVMSSHLAAIALGLFAGTKSPSVGHDGGRSRSELGSDPLLYAS